MIPLNPAPPPYGWHILHLQKSGFHFLDFAVNADEFSKFLIPYGILLHNTESW